MLPWLLGFFAAGGIAAIRLRGCWRVWRSDPAVYAATAAAWQRARAARSSPSPIPPRKKER